jgi:Fic family protein
MKYKNTDINIDDRLLKKIEEKKRRLDSLRPLKKDVVNRILEDIRIRHTYHSDAIEGNTLTLQETKLVLEQGITVGGKPLKDHIEARNDADAFSLMINLVRDGKPISQEVIQQIHKIVTKGLLEDAGKYRVTNVRIAGSATTPPSYVKIVTLMDDYIKNITKFDLEPIKKAAFIHHEFVLIHPFADGNGRVARLLTNLFLMHNGYPPIIVKQEDRGKYYSTLQKADKGNISPFATFIAKAVNEALMYYLSSFIDEERLIPLKEMAKYAPYSQEYLSLRARQGELDAIKIENIWHSSNRSLKSYLRKMK